MKRLLLILSVAAGLTIAGCGSDDSGHSHGEEGDHTHETEQHAHDDASEAGHQHDAEEGDGHSHENSETTESSHTHSEGEEEHSHSGEDAHSHEGEEPGTRLGLNDTYEQVRKGIRLNLSYDSESGSFTGTIENTTQEALPQVSVGVELSNGSKLGPTTPVNLDVGESQSVELDATGESFDSWSAHSQMGNGGHSHGEDGDHEHHN